MNSRGYSHKNQDRGWSFVGRSKRYDLAEDETTRQMVDRGYLALCQRRGIQPQGVWRSKSMKEPE